MQILSTFQERALPRDSRPICYAATVPITLVIADDHPVVLDGLAHLFADCDDFVVVAQCRDGEEALLAIRKHKPDVAVVDIRMPRRNGMEVLRTTRSERISTRVALLTAELTDDEVLDAVRVGAAAILLKESASKQLIDAVRIVAAGGTHVDPQMLHRALDRSVRMGEGAREVARVLTPRELEVVRLVAKGLRNREIAEQLSISEGTVKLHLHSIYEKLKVSGRVELTLYARDHSLV
jgi:DNA-binding NarL/FixJ family response regulator